MTLILQFRGQITSFSLFFVFFPGGKKVVHKRHLPREMDFLILETVPRVTPRSSRNFGSNLNIKEDKAMTQCWESLLCKCIAMFALNFKGSHFQDSYLEVIWSFSAEATGNNRTVRQLKCESSLMTQSSFCNQYNHEGEFTCALYF